MDEKEKAGLFGLGQTNDAYAQYFVGQSYLNLLTKDRLVTGAIIRNGASRLRSFIPAMSSTFRRK